MGWQGRDLDRAERIGRTIARVGKTEIVRRQGEGGVFDGGQRGVGARRCVGHRAHDDSECLCADVPVVAHQIAALDREGDGGGTRPVGSWHKAQGAEEGVDVRHVALRGKRNIGDDIGSGAGADLAANADRDHRFHIDAGLGRIDAEFPGQVQRRVLGRRQSGDRSGGNGW